jgi:hypothetical protein
MSASPSNRGPRIRGLRRGHFLVSRPRGARGENSFRQYLFDFAAAPRRGGRTRSRRDRRAHDGWDPERHGRRCGQPGLEFTARANSPPSISRSPAPWSRVGAVILQVDARRPPSRANGFALRNAPHAADGSAPAAICTGSRTPQSKPAPETTPPGRLFSFDEMRISLSYHINKTTTEFR